MRWYYDMKIAAKLIIGFVVVALIAAVVGVVGVVNINKINELDTDMYERHTATLDDMAVVLQTYQQKRVILRDLLIIEDKNEWEGKVNQLKTMDATIAQGMTSFEEGVQSEEMRGLFQQLKDLLEEYRAYEEKTVALISNGQIDKAEVSLYSDGVKISDAVQKSGDGLLKLKVDRARESSQANDKAALTATTTMFIIIVIGVILSIALGIFISRIISKPVGKMVEAANQLAIGNVNVNVEADTKDEIGSLADSFAKMIANIRSQAMTAEKIASGDLTVEVDVRSQNDLLGKKLKEMVDKNNQILNSIANASQQVAAGSKQVSDSSISLSQGATEQASSIEELTASLEEIASQTKLNAQNANQANELAEVAKTNALQGNSQMKEMQKAMEDINTSSSNISKIIKVIDDIAFQTNILALNAAVEAARAGQHGKGFAVVAEEVRNLAARSANAAKETTDMIEGSINKVAAGTKIANNTAEALNKIVEDVAKAANLVADIATASNEQAASISQINQGIMQVSQVVQTNSATSEESAAASEELSSQAELLRESVSKFKLKTSQTYSKLDELSPEVRRLLDNLSEKKDIGSEFQENSKITKKESKHRIVLSDSEFGKY